MTKPYLKDGRYVVQTADGKEKPAFTELPGQGPKEHRRHREPCGWCGRNFLADDETPEFIFSLGKNEGAVDYSRIKKRGKMCPRCERRIVGKL